MWIPTNTIAQHFNNDPSQPVKLIRAHNTAFDWMGYQEVDLEPCPEYEAKGGEKVTSAEPFVYSSPFEWPRQRGRNAQE
jgi:hypothetical protein